MPTKAEIEAENKKLKEELQKHTDARYQKLRREAMWFFRQYEPWVHPKPGWEFTVKCDHGNPVVCYHCNKVLCCKCERQYFSEQWGGNGHWLYVCGNCQHKAALARAEEKKKQQEALEQRKQENLRRRQEKIERIKRWFLNLLRSTLLFIFAPYFKVRDVLNPPDKPSVF